MTLFRPQIVHKGFTAAFPLLVAIVWGGSSCTPSTDPGLKNQENQAGDAWALYEALGEECAENEDCEGAFCSDGLCCAKICSGPCESCNRPGFEGQCLAKPCAYPVPFGWDFLPEDSSENRLALKAPADSAQSSCFNSTDKIECPGEAESKACSEVSFCGQDAQYAHRSAWVRTDRFVSLTEGWILDQSTQLLWQDLKLKSSWNNSQLECAELGDGSWRVPKREELMSLVTFETHEPATDFPGASTGIYWTQVALISDEGRAWTLSFVDGASLPMDIEDEYFSLCVRARSAK